MLAHTIPANATKEDIEHFKYQWNNSKTIRERLIEIFKERLEKSITEDENISNMEKANWEIRQAHSLGRRKALREIIEHLDQEA